MIKYLAILITAFCIFDSCKERTDSKISERDISCSLNYLLDNVISKATHGDKYMIDSTFEKDLTISDLTNLSKLREISDSDIPFITPQYEKLKGKEIGRYLNGKYLNKLLGDVPDLNVVYYWFAPPMFSLDKKIVVLYAKSIFKVKEDYKWDDLYFILKKQNETYSLLRYVKSSDIGNEK